MQVRHPLHLPAIATAVLFATMLTAQAGLDSVSCIGPYRYHSDWCRDCTASAAGKTGAALHSDGSLTVWGTTAGGGLDVPALPPGTSYVDVVVCTSGAVIALRSDQALLAFGPNWYGEGSVPAPPPGRHFTALARCHGSNHVAALLSDGSVVEWGYPYPGGATAPALPPGLSWTRIATGPSHALGLRSDGSVVAWGSNIWNQLPVLSPGTVCVDVAVSSNHSMVVRADGTAQCFGTNPDFGAVPPPPAGTSYVQAGGADMTFVLRRSDGALVTHGFDYWRISQVPPLPPGLQYVDLSVGLDFVLARRSDGMLVGWGRNGHAECNVPVGPPGIDFSEVLAGGRWQNFGLRRDGTLAVWGDYSDYQYPPTAWPFDVPPLPAGVTYVQIAAGVEHLLALRSDGQVIAIGMNSTGQLQVPAPPAGTSYIGVGAGEFQSFVLRSDGVMLGFGLNQYGQCNVPPAGPGLRYVAVDGSELCSIALRSDGQLVAFGNTGSFGQGIVPALPAGTSWRSISLGKYHAVALRSDGQLIAWGNNNAGQCNVPALPAGVYYVAAAASVAGLHTVARRSDGVVVAFGDNSEGQCNIPQPPPGRGHTGIDAGDAFTILRTGAPSTYSRTGTGCAGSRPASRLIPQDTPRIGAVLRIEVTDLPLDVAIVCTGFDPAHSSLGPLPLDLQGLGMPGCTLYTSLDGVQFLVGSGGRARYELAIPQGPSFVGMQFQQQALVVDPGAPNSLGAVVSEAATGRIGR